MDDGTKLPGIQITSVVFNITILDVNDPPLFLSPNVTIVPEIQEPGTVVYTIQPFDADGDEVQCYIIGGNDNTAVMVNGSAAPAFAIDPSASCNLTTASWLVRGSIT